MIFSAIVPSRSRPLQFRESVAALYGLAAKPSEVEVVARLDADDLLLDAYMETLRRFPGTCYIIGQRGAGYSSLTTFMDEAARFCHGDLVLSWNDDMLVETQGWDDLIVAAIGGRDVAVATCRLRTPAGDRSSQCQFACATITRKVMERCGGGLKLGDCLDLDRAWQVFAERTRSHVEAPVDVVHHQNEVSTPDTNSSRDAFYRAAGGDWSARKRVWDETGARYAALFGF